MKDRTQYQKTVSGAKKLLQLHGKALIEAHNSLEHGIKLHRKGGDYTATPLFRSAEEEKQTKLF